MCSQLLSWTIMAPDPWYSKYCPVDQQCLHHKRSLAFEMQNLRPHPNLGFRICILTISPGDLYAH